MTRFRKGDVRAVIETDKAAMEMEAYDEGVLTRILVQEWASVPIGTPIAVIGEGAAEAAAPPPVPAPGDPERAVVPPVAPAPSPGAEAAPAERPPASPLARKLAREHGVDLTVVSGSGPGGRIVRADIEQAARARDGPGARRSRRRQLLGRCGLRLPGLRPRLSRPSPSHLSPRRWRRWPRPQTPRRSR